MAVVREREEVGAEIEPGLIAVSERGLIELLRRARQLPSLGEMEAINKCRIIGSSHKTPWEYSDVVWLAE